jgi:5-methylthioadenosine/S-adenosylhomocysteine deaminase
MTINTTLIKNADWVIAWDDEKQVHQYIQNADVVFSDDTITYVGKKYEGPFQHQREGKNLCIMPGLVNIHAHPFTEIMTKGALEDGLSGQLGELKWFNDLFVFLPDQEDQLICAEMAYSELIMSGVTTLVDISHPYPGWNDLAEKSGLRMYLAPMFTSTEGMWDAKNGYEIEYNWVDDEGKQKLSEALEVVDQAMDNNSGRLSGMIMPTTIDTCTESLLQDCLSAAKKRSIPLQIHAAQFMTEFREITNRYGVTPVQLLDRFGLLSPETIISHGIFFDHHNLSNYWGTQKDLEIFSQSGASVAHCPTNYARTWGLSIQDFGRYNKAGINMGIGTDTYPHNMLEEIRLALMIGRVVSNSIDGIKTADGFNAATIGGAKALNRKDLGRLAPGAKADLVLVDLDHPSMKPMRDPLRSLIYQAADRAVKDVYVGGEKILENGRVLTMDYQGVSSQLNDVKERIAKNACNVDVNGRRAEEISPLALSLAPE